MKYFYFDEQRNLAYVLDTEHDRCGELIGTIDSAPGKDLDDRWVLAALLRHTGFGERTGVTLLYTAPIKPEAPTRNS